MTIEQLKSGSYRVSESVDGYRYRVTFDHKPTQKEAKLALAELEASKVQVKSGKFRSFAEQYISSKENVVSPTTVTSYKSFIRNMPEWFLNLNLKDVDQYAVQKMINEYSVGRSPKSVKCLHGFVATVLKMYRPNLVLHTTLPQAEKHMEYEPTDEDVRRILQYAAGSDYDVALNLAVFGMRRSEVIAVTADDVKPFNSGFYELTINKAKVLGEDGFTVKSTKTTESTRTILIPADIAEKILERGYAYNGYPGCIYKYLQRAQDKLGIPRFRLHQLRHYYASMCLGMGMPITYVESSGGWKHGSKALNEAYTYVQNKKLKEQQEKAAEFILALKG